VREATTINHCREHLPVRAETSGPKTIQGVQNSACRQIPQSYSVGNRGEHAAIRAEDYFSNEVFVSAIR
jgi:hypothetical protein